MQYNGDKCKPVTCWSRNNCTQLLVLILKQVRTAKDRRNSSKENLLNYGGILLVRLPDGARKYLAD